MIPEREIEERLKAKFAAALAATRNAASIRTVGFWDVAADGEVKGEGDASDVVLAVATGIRAYDSFCSPQADFRCSAVLTVRRDACPTGATLAALLEPLLDLVHRWNEDADAVFDDLTTDRFSPGGFMLSGGDPTQDADAWTVPLVFTLRGVITPAPAASSTTNESE
jgi:hypothetical protein